MSRFVTWLKALAVVLLALAPLAAVAEDRANPCGAGAVTSGGGDVVVEGKQAARAGDTAGCPGSTIVQGSPDVFINGKPAAVEGDRTGCGGSIVSGASGVFINGKPMARVGDAAGCPGK
ncbi:PAAR domain-containing protein [Methyloceanibacter sp.]|uniref:PAAR domain-containing protein n=1 Tax=Methyloceanibacter sp. TaxID=1965321 RepID=UPI003D6C82B3